MKLVLAALFLAQACPAGAFLFWGGRDREAEARLREMRAAQEAGDCQAVLSSADLFLGEKPPAGMREEAYGYIGRCYETYGSEDKAISLYKLAIELYPANLGFAASLAAIYNRTGFPEHAAPLFLKVIASRPGDLPATLGLARAYSAMGFLSKAAAFYSRAVAAQNFSDEETLAEYADCLLRKRDWPEALFIASKGSRLEPRSARWPRIEAKCMAGQGDYAAAAAALERAIKFSPARELRLERALYLLLGGLPNRAAQAADAELSADPADPLAAVVKGLALYSLGKKDEAAPYLRTASRAGGFTGGVALALLGSGEEENQAVCRK